MPKLVRDKIPAIAESAGATVTTRVLTVEEFRVALKLKLLEEAAEAATAPTEEFASEIADVLEVVRAMYDAFGLDPTEVEALRASKAAERGGFEGRIFLE